MQTAVGLQPPSYRLAVANQYHVISRQSTTVEPRPDMTSRDVYRVGSRGVNREVSVPHTTGVLRGRIFDEERIRRLSSPVVDWDTVGIMYQRPTALSSRCARPETSAATCSLPREVSYDRDQDRSGTTTTTAAAAAAARFSSTSSQFHKSSYSAPAAADCTTPVPRPRTVPATTLLPCGPGVRANKVSMRTKYHLTSTHRPNVTSPTVKEGQRSRSNSRSQQGARLWVGMAQVVDIRPVSTTALTATVDCNNRKFLLFLLRLPNYYNILNKHITL